MHGLSFDTIKKAALVTGCIGLVTSAAMTGRFGWETSITHAIGFVCVTVLAAIIYPAVSGLRARGFRKMAVTMSVAAPFFLALELFGDLGYTIGMRDKTIKGATHQTVSYDDIGVTIASQEQLEKSYTERLENLTTANKWLGTVNADGLKSKLASHNLAIEQEAARGGCKGKCLELTRARDELAARIAVAEEASKIPAILAVTKKKLEELRAQRAAAPVGHSAAKSQTDFVAKIFLATSGAGVKATLNPDDYTLSFTEIFIGLFIAIGVMMLPTTCFAIAFADDEKQPARYTIATPLVPVKRSNELARAIADIVSRSNLRPA